MHQKELCSRTQGAHAPPVHRFFPSVVYLATSKVAVATLGNLAFALALLVYHGIVKVLLAELSSLRSCVAGHELARASACLPDHSSRRQCLILSHMPGVGRRWDSQLVLCSG